MVHDPDQFIHIGNVRVLQLVVVHIDSKMSGSVIAHETVNFHCVDISGFYGIHTGRAGDDFFCDSHSHDYASSLFSDAISPPWSRMFCI